MNIAFILLNAGEAAAKAVEQTGPGLLGVDWKTMVIVFVNLLVLVLLFRSFLYKPVQKMLEERKNAASKEMDEAKTLQAESQKKLSEADTVIADAREQAKKIHSDSIVSAESMKDEIVNKAREEAKSIIKSAEDEAKGEREISDEVIKERSKKILAQISKSVASEIFSAGNNVFSYTKSVVDTLPDQIACDLSGNKGKLCDFLKSVKSVNKVMITSAMELPEDMKAKIKDFIASAASGKPTYSFAVDPTIISGLKLSFDDTIFDTSVAKIIESTVKSMR
ncbi:MAG: F0F1 ATP synthase subunit delta [Caldisericia bacterium]|nr:F0F1 ATP synthase subunit delta [Caldisericia bacterium]